MIGEANVAFSVMQVDLQQGPMVEKGAHKDFCFCDLAERRCIIS